MVAEPKLQRHIIFEQCSAGKESCPYGSTKGTRMVVFHFVYGSIWTLNELHIPK